MEHTMCRRIWWKRPVFGFTSTSVNTPSLASWKSTYLRTRQMLTACFPSNGESMSCHAIEPVGSTSNPISKAVWDEINVSGFSLGRPFRMAKYVFFTLRSLNCCDKWSIAGSVLPMINTPLVGLSNRWTAFGLLRALIVPAFGGVSANGMAALTVIWPWSSKLLL